MHRMCVACLPRISKSSRMHAQFLPRIQGPPTRTSVLWCRMDILPAPSYHQPSLMTGGGGRNSSNLAACPSVPVVDCTAPTNVANGVRTPFLNPQGAAGGGAAAPPPPAAINLLPAHPGQAGAANNLARVNQQRVANAAVAGVGGVVYIDEVEAETMRRPRNRDNIDALDGINSAMLQATRMISAAIGRAHQQPPQHQPPATAAAGVAPGGGDGDLIASFYARLANARAANRMDAVNRYERMINRLESKEEEEMEAHLLNPN